MKRAIIFDTEWIRLSNFFKNPFMLDDVQSFWEGVFDGIEYKPESFFIKKIGPDHISSIFRARCFNDPYDIEKVFENPGDMLGPPPATIACGRMNSDSQSVFYGAEEKETAVAEIRPPVGSYVAVGRFTILTDNELFDISAFDRIFDHNELKITRDQSDFLKSLSNRVSFPVAPNNTNEYFMTQSLIFFIKNKFKKINGVRYDSPQTGYDGNNIMLFESNFSVERVKYQRCHVTPVSWEDAPCTLNIKYQLDQADASILNQNVTLKLSPDDIDVFRIESVNYTCEKSFCNKHF